MCAVGGLRLLGELKVCGTILETCGSLDSMGYLETPDSSSRPKSVRCPREFAANPVPGIYRFQAIAWQTPDFPNVGRGCLLSAISKVNTLNEARDIADDAQNPIPAAITYGYSIDTLRAVLEIHAVDKRGDVTNDADNPIAIPVMRVGRITTGWHRIVRHRDARVVLDDQRYRGEVRITVQWIVGEFQRRQIC